MKYVLDIGTKQVPGAAVKPRKDIDDILSSNGWKVINIYNTGLPVIIRNVDEIAKILFLKFHLKKDDIVLIQWTLNLIKPLTKINIENLFHAKKILLLHDIESLRSKKLIFSEKDRFNSYDALISHNSVMSNWLKKNGIVTNIVNLGPFDYLVSESPNNNHLAAKVTSKKKNGIYRVAFAGNLSTNKSGFIYHLPKVYNYKLFLYGNGYDSINEDVAYVGSFMPEEIVTHLDCDFGLVWDGPDIDTCGGTYGDYLRFNCPHKFSLYIAAKLPVIVWKESALAPYVEKNQIGICVSSLIELDDVLKEISDDTYNSFLSNVLRLRDRLIKGKDTLEVVESATEIIRNE